MRSLAVLFATTIVTVVVAACSGSGSPAAPAMPSPSSSAGSSGAPSTAATSGPTFHKDVEPIMQSVCQNCHVAGGIAPFALVTYADAQAVSDDIVGQTQSKAMPPWGAQDTSECTPPAPWKDDLRLSDAQIATIAAWNAAGSPEGDPADAPPPRTAPPDTGLTGDGVTNFTPATPFSLQATTDTFRCFVFDPKLTATVNLDATNVIPGNKTIVHHAVIYQVPSGTTLPSDTQYDCFGGPGVSNASLVAAWAPGGVPNQLPAGVAMQIAAGTRFVMQVHYHPHANATQAPDATTFQYHLTPNAPTYIAKPQLLGNFKSAVNAAGYGLEPGPDDPPSGVAFEIPANAPAHVETMKFTMPAFPVPTVWLLGVGGHMHLAGHDEKITLTHANGSGQSTCLMQEPAWDFNWQRGYQYDRPVEELPTVAKGDVLEMRCTYDNTMQNIALANALTEAGMNQPQSITLGESTTDEMCLGAFTFVYKAP